MLPTVAPAGTKSIPPLPATSKPIWSFPPGAGPDDGAEDEDGGAEATTVGPDGAGPQLASVDALGFVGHARTHCTCKAPL
jgi:hypothetical protein